MLPTVAITRQATVPHKAQSVYAYSPHLSLETLSTLALWLRIFYWQACSMESPRATDPNYLEVLSISGFCFLETTRKWAKRPPTPPGSATSSIRPCSRTVPGFQVALPALLDLRYYLLDLPSLSSLLILWLSCHCPLRGLLFC